jgi:4'-phosphopantetheinyl transferase
MFFPLSNPAPANLSLANDDIHIWCASLEVPISRTRMLLNTLSPDERKRAGRFHFAKDRKHFIVGRGILRTLLGKYLAIEPGKIQFCYGNYGKPEISYPVGQKKIHFNISHSDGVALFVFTLGRKIGIDIEKVRDISGMVQISKRFFSTNEYHLFSALPQNQMKKAFFNCWTRKEAFLKATGKGLAMPMDSFEVSFMPGEPVSLLNIQSAKKNSANWILRALSCIPGYISAIAVETDRRHRVCWQYNVYPKTATSS